MKILATVLESTMLSLCVKRERDLNSFHAASRADKTQWVVRIRISSKSVEEHANDPQSEREYSMAIVDGEMHTMRAMNRI